MADGAIGFEGKLYVKAGGVAAGGSWLEVVRATDVGLKAEAEQIEVSSRASAWKLFRQGMKTVEVTVSVIFDESEAAFIALRDAFLSALPATQKIGVKMLPRTSESGPQFDANVFSMERSEPLDGPTTVDFMLKPVSGSVTFVSA